MTKYEPLMAKYEVSLLLLLLSQLLSHLPISPTHLKRKNFKDFYKSPGFFHTMKTSEALAFSSEALLPQVFLISCLDSGLWIMGTTFYHEKNYSLS